MTSSTAHDDAVVLHDAAVRRGGRLIWSHGNFAIPRGTVTAVVGTNGAGKTTLLDAELGLIPTSQGGITVLGRPAGQSNQRIGYVPQTYTSGLDSTITARQSVILGLTGTKFGIHLVSAKEKQRAQEVLEFVGLADKADYRLNELSGGLRQRAAIAQALACGPELLLLDEPLANLDIASQRSVVELLARLNREWGMTIEVVAHDLNMLLPILTGAIYLLDGHPHYSPIRSVLDSDLLTHLYGTRVEVVTTPQGDMFVTPNRKLEPEERLQDTHDVREAAHFHEHGGAQGNETHADAYTAGTKAKEMDR
ncbi:ATP-binding cassette domain-containing protein [Bifidobacterium sp. SMB2]|uniref:ATP-binding cassette domain-containing protein n=1 Tax=Bifidobacterium saimiriisciurei TaxID=2661627 RepID=A0ABX0C9B3_9BIFI|nr:MULTISPECIES: ATP-binding cassette domain-containing protein [Bifidobacterium]NEG96133.1 ATP-binding cassette domain-containing protein [Bifidobacterium sp. SMB2]NEH10789.1 ATP-binding cassette domain-containing protein [Bifidobacterium saimiriisciurei]